MIRKKRTARKTRAATSRRETHLVTQHMENVSRTVLEKYQDIVRQYVRGRWGIYVLYRRGKLYYVGLASNLRSRLAHHLRDRHSQSWDRFSVYLTVRDSHLRELETLILRTVKPAGNKQRGKLPRSEDLRKKLTKDIRRKHTDDLMELIGRTARVDKPRRVRKVSGREPVLAKYVTKAMVLRALYKGRTVRARVRKDGRIRVNGKLHDSPSLAGAAACKRRTCNGWTFWEFERSPGNWVSLNELRR